LNESELNSGLDFEKGDFMIEGILTAFDAYQTVKSLKGIFCKENSDNKVCTTLSVMAEKVGDATKFVAQGLTPSQNLKKVAQSREQVPVACHFRDLPVGCYITVTRNSPELEVNEIRPKREAEPGCFEEEEIDIPVGCYLEYRPIHKE
jgi:hypothetical protein